MKSKPMPEGRLEQLLLEKRLDDAKDAARQHKEDVELLQDEIAELKATVDYLLKLKRRSNHPPRPIAAKRKSASQSVAVIQYSDWHCEETVDGAMTGGLNSYSLGICDRRSNNCAQNTAALINLQRQGTDIDTLVLHLGGDYISGYIHEELVEVNSLSPTRACLWVLERLRAAIRHILAATQVKRLVLVCSVGNHGRTTKKTHIATRTENSFEWLMYMVLGQFLEAEFGDRIDFRCEPGYHTFVHIYGQDYRFHHGDAFKFGGGVGGITIPVLKKIAQWDKAKRAAHDFFGHFHQRINHPKFSCNGSLIGYGPFSVEIGAEFELPQQALTLIEHKHGRTITAPIFCED